MIILTGGAGFIGSAMVWELNRYGEKNIIIVDDLGSTTTNKWRNLSGLHFADFIQKDLFPDLLESGAFRDISAIIHMGANSSTTETDADHLLVNNYGYSKKLASYCMAHDTRLIYASSAATYGDGSNGYSDNIAEIDRLRPLNMYGYSKQLFDRWADANGILTHAAGLKFFNVYGPNEYHKQDMSSVVFKAYHQICEKGSVELFRSHRPDYRDGEQLRDFVYVRDCTRIMLWLLDNPSATGLFNVGTGTARSFLDLAKATFSALGQEPVINYTPMPETLRDKYQYYTCADMTRLRSAGYHEPFTSLEEGVKEYVQHYLAADNPWLDLAKTNS
ncbi:ADP-glyceromanno-heptose 6-epimerase [Chlorobium sp. BLA1]|uniref:ADP-glyceromanno-heptose 6-epimerase n=1 Tax=Candidatus Chlorobium masyuteum TaxID=2716876 RepID=UPI00141F71C2|nr:ADP-glyceromanno-heptose 6-epimerase [Candidatus Chlorobium masyuteum]NHQ60984.1 ADP-glyceromanno-heptose 6-epimerase [Candidatus Chlorobium masyuteum]